MKIKYDLCCFDETLVITFPDGYEWAKEEIYLLLDQFYDEWNNPEQFYNGEDYLCVHDSCLPEYMMDRLSETFNQWIEWEVVE